MRPGRRYAFIVALTAAAGLAWVGCKDSTGPEETETAASYVHIRASWSPDGRTIAYRDESTANAGVWLVDSSGTNPRRLVAGEGIGFTWSPDSRWLAFSALGVISKIRITGDSLSKLTTGSNDIRPSWSPDGTQIAFVRNGISLVRLSSLTTRQLASSGNFPSWHPNGKEVVLLDQLLQPSGVQYQYYVDAVDTSNGASRSLHEFTSAASCGFGRIGPDGAKYLMRVQSQNELSQVWVLDLTTSVTMKLTTDGGDYPAWNPDGSMIVYTRTTVGDGGLWIMSADGAGKKRLTTP